MRDRTRRKASLTRYPPRQASLIGAYPAYSPFSNWPRWMAGRAHRSLPGRSWC